MTEKTVPHGSVLLPTGRWDWAGMVPPGWTVLAISPLARKAGPAEYDAAMGEMEHLLVERSRAAVSAGGPPLILSPNGLRDGGGGMLLRRVARRFLPAYRVDGPDFPAARRPRPVQAIDHPGPFDLIGDVHGCHEEFLGLLRRLGYRPDDGMDHPEGRTLVFLGDIVERGPDSVAACRLAVAAVRAGRAFWVMGNHDDNLLRFLLSRKASRNHGGAELMEAFADVSQEERADIAGVMAELPAHLVLDGGRLVATHAGIRPELVGSESPAGDQLALRGIETGERDEHGFPVRGEWEHLFPGGDGPFVVCGHVIGQQVRHRGNTMCLDTGCYAGGALTALRWPERELVAEPSLRCWWPHPAVTPGAVGPSLRS